MAESNCADCTLRAKYDEKPKSFAGRFWRWHINWCSGWKGYMKSLDEAELAELKQQYHLR